MLFSLFLLRKVYFYGLSVGKVGLLQFGMVFFLAEEPHYADEGDADGYGITEVMVEGESLGGDADIAAAYEHHEDAGHEGYPVGFAVTGEPYGDRPEGEDAQGLVGPPEVAPQYIEVDEHECQCSCEEGYADDETLVDLVLLEVEYIGGDESGGAEGCVAGGDGGCHHSEDGEHGAHGAEPRMADAVDEQGGVHLAGVWVGHVVEEFLVGGVTAAG